ncbi:DNA (cytosine-5)-methyltransferase 1 [Rhodococcus sp. 27YEA15]|uniref:DNA cytosine methyltransferase n=1 Tax=Rhodococcus sp. 27YEA15 TaxID=3156259 RepID=UPI003C79A8D6
MSPSADSPAFESVQMVDLFAGPGGLDVAARWLGVSVVGIEWDPNACRTRAEAGLTTQPGDVRAFGPQGFPSARYLAGGPPCQTFTVAGSGAGRKALDGVVDFIKRLAADEDISADLLELDDERTGLVLEPLRWALEADKLGHPYEVIVLEQVPAVLPVWEAMGRALEGIGYQFTCDILHTEEFGVPQTRRRAILVARRGREPKLPDPTHRRYKSGTARHAGLPGLLEWKSMGDVFPERGPFAVISNYGSGGVSTARGRRTSEQPAFTVTGKVSRNRVITPSGIEMDRFSPSEAGRLQTFPRDYPWAGGDVGQQIGNAIPPRLAAHVLAAALFDGTLDDTSLNAAIASPWSAHRETTPTLVPSRR